MLVDEFMPVYDVSDAVDTVVDADLPTTWAALMDVDLIEVGRKRPLISAQYRDVEWIRAKWFGNDWVMLVVAVS